MQAIVISASGCAKFTGIKDPIISRGGAILKTVACGLCGTDVLKINKHLITKPTVLGHEYVGMIREISPEVTDFKPGDVVVAAHHVPCGDCVYCRGDSPTMCKRFKASNFDPGGFAEFTGISSAHLRHVTCKIPPGLPWQEALFTEPFACCLRHWRRAALQKGETAVVVGLGSIGIMMAALLKYHGVNVIAAELDAKRRGTARALGITTVHHNTGAEFKRLVHDKTGGIGANAVIFTAGPATLMNDAIEWLSDGGALHLFSHLSGETAPLDVAQLYHREIRVITTYSSAPADFRDAFELLRTSDFNFRRLLAPAYAPADFDRAVADVNARRVLKAMIAFA